MKNYYTKFMSFAAMLIAAVLLMPDTTQAQEYVETQIDDGKEYWIGVPNCRKEEGEKFRGGFPMQLWVSSKVDTRVNVKADYIGMDQFYAVKKNEIKVIPLNDELMNKESEEIKDYGIQIIGDDPINVVVYLSYQWSGEAYRCIPVEWLGKKYVTFNLYLDKTDDYRPPQFLIVATKNNTRVSYIPSGNTVKHDAGRKVDITLNQGQTYLVEGRMTPGMVHMDQTDLSGTLIQSTEPIAVISGHTKGAFPRYQSHMLGRAANFMRNMITEMLWPTELLGKKYISAPILYKNRKRGVSPDDKGDLMRFIATENGTDIYRMRQDGTGEMLMWTGLDRGEWRDIVTQEDAAMYTANKPIAVAQYGKTWWDHEVTPIIGKDDKPQNPSRNGQGMLITLAPIERWCTYAAFKSPEGIDNFFYMTFKDGTMDKIKFDGQSLLAKFGSAVKPIKGTPYVYLATEIGIGDHWI
ncbi:MAG: IgGFc-binding protein, partial [Bacteroidota bacterium]